MPFKKGSQYRQIEGEIKLLQKKGEFLFSTEIWLLNDAVNRNNWRYTDMKGNMAQFAGTPVLIAYVSGGKTVGDGHNMREEYDANGDPAPSFTDATAERIVGAISDDVNDIRLEVRDGNTWIVAKASLWRWYAKELVEKIERDARQGRNMSISIETLVTKCHMEGNVEVEDEYKILGTTILGDHVAPAVADAHIAALAKKEGFNQLKIRAASYIGQNSDQKPQKDIKTKGMNKDMNYLSKQQLAEHKNRFAGYTVLAAMQDGENTHFAMLGADYIPAVYTMENNAETVVPEKIAKVNAKVTFRIDNDKCMEIDSGDMMECLTTELLKANTELAAVKAELAKKTEKINSMETIENKRRVEAAKEKAVNTLSAFNANRVGAVDEKVLDDVRADIEKGLYTNSVNEEGIWIGDKAVEEKVLSLCAMKVMEMDKATHDANQKQFVWDQKPAKDEHDDGTVGGLLASVGIK